MHIFNPFFLLLIVAILEADPSLSPHWHSVFYFSIAKLCASGPRHLPCNWNGEEWVFPSVIKKRCGTVENLIRSADDGFSLSPDMSAYLCESSSLFTPIYENWVWHRESWLGGWSGIFFLTGHKQHIRAPLHENLGILYLLIAWFLWAIKKNRDRKLSSTVGCLW